MARKGVKHASKKIFTDEEKQYIIDNWGTVSVYQMKKKFNCSWNAVANYGKIKGLPMPTQKHLAWDEEDIDKLRELAPKMHYKKIAKKLGRSNEAVYEMGQKLGITLIQDHRDWTLEEIAYLKENWGKEKIETLAKHLRRTPSVLKQKANVLGLGPAIKRDIELILISDICEILGISRERVTKTFVNHGLFLRKNWISNKKFYYYVLYDDLMTYLKKNQDTWDSRNLELYGLGIEEDWLKEKRQRDIKDDPSWHREWTINEIQKAIDIFLHKKNYQAVADELHRSLGAVKTILRERGYGYSLPKFWQAKEIAFLKANYETMSYSEIGRYLDRTEKSVSKMASILGFKKNNHEDSFEYRIWTEEEIEKLKILVKMYSPTKIAKKLNRTKSAVERKIKILKISVSSADRLWPPEEEEELRALWKTCDIAKIARLLERPITTIRTKAKEMHLGLNRGDEILVSDICSLLNVSRGIVVNRYLKLGLQVNPNITSGGRTYYTVKVKNLLEFLKDNLDAWDSSNLELGALGEEEDWLKNKRQKDEENNIAWKKILTTEEYNLINTLYEANIPALEIARKLNKPYDLIASLLEIDKKHNAWKIKEIVFLMENYDKLSFAEIATIIGRTKQAVNTKASSLGLVKRDSIRMRKKHHN